MATRKLHYSDFVSRIDVDAFEAAIGFVPFTTNRGNDIGHCIFPENHKHGDTTGKFAIERNERIYNCFVCGGGNLLSLAMEVTNLDVEEATEWLYQFTGTELQSDVAFADDLIAMLEAAEERVKTLPYFNERVLDGFNGSTDYFLERGISQHIVEEFNLRFDEEATKLAPIKTIDGSKIKQDQDYVGPASIWPHYWQGRLVGWQYRWHDYPDTPKWLPKWTNTTDFPKSSTLFNYDKALQAKDHPVIVCESLGTVLFLASYDIPAVAYFGSKPTDEQKRLLRRFNQGVVLAPDNDSNMAGDKILGVIDYLERYIPVWVADKVEGQDGADLGDYAYTDDPERHVRHHLEHRVQLPGLSL